MILYKRLWETMKKKNISQYRLLHYYRFSSGQLDRLRKNSPVSTHTIDMLCQILDCQVEDIMEYRSDHAGFESDTQQASDQAADQIPDQTADLESSEE